MTKVDLRTVHFTGADVIKLFGLVIAVGVQFNLLKKEIHENKVFDIADKRIINYQIAELQKCCGIVGIKPDEVKIKFHE